MLCSIGLIVSRLQGAKALRQGRLTFNAGSGATISLIGYTLFIALPTLFPGSETMMWVGYYGCAILLGLGNGHLWPAFQNMTINVAPVSRRGTANSTILISWDVGMGLGVLLGGVIAEHLGYGSAFWAVVLVNTLGVLTFFLATKTFFLRRNLNATVR